MKTKLVKNIIAMIAALAAATSLVPAEAQESSGKQSIVGTWQMLRHGVDCVTGERLGPDFPALITFNRGGTLNAYAIPPNGSTPANTSPEYGNWSRVPGTCNFTFREVTYNYDDNGVFTGRAEVTASLTLDAGGDSLTADSTIDFYDAGGNLLFSACGMSTATRFE